MLQSEARVYNGMRQKREAERQEEGKKGAVGGRSWWRQGKEVEAARQNLLYNIIYIIKLLNTIIKTVSPPSRYFYIST